MSMDSIRMDVQIDEGCDCGSVKKYGEKMRDGGGSFIDRMRTVGSQDRPLYKLEYWDLEKSRDTHTKGGYAPVKLLSRNGAAQEPQP